ISVVILYYHSAIFFFFFQAEDGIRDFHVTGVQTCALPIFDLHRADTEAYVHNLESREPAVYVVLSNRENPTEDQPYDLSQVTVSPYEVQYVLDSAEELVERIRMPPVMIVGVHTFVKAHHIEGEL